MLDLIGAASHWVHFDSYIFRDDATGRRFGDALSERPRAGVAVRVSTDWLGSLGTGRRFWRQLESAGASVRRFNRPGPFDLASLLTRNHRKLVVADGNRAVLGGMGIGNEWAGDPQRGHLPWRDTAVTIAIAVSALALMLRRRRGDTSGGSPVPTGGTPPTGGPDRALVPPAAVVPIGIPVTPEGARAPPILKASREVVLLILLLTLILLIWLIVLILVTHGKYYSMRKSDEFTYSV